MKNTSKRLLTGAVAALMLLSSCAPVTEAPETTSGVNDPPITGFTGDTSSSDIALPYYGYEERVETKSYEITELSSQYVSVNREAEISKNVLKVPKSRVGGINIDLPTADTDTATLEYTLTSPKSDVPWFTLYQGFRLNSSDADPTGGGGVWLALYGDKIGLRTGSWPETTYTSSPVDLSNATDLRFEDDPVKNEIRILASGELIATVKISGSEYSLFTAGSDTAAVTSKTSGEIPRSGYVKPWGHIPDNDIIIDNFKFITKSNTIYGDSEIGGIIPTTVDVFADTWTASDAAGRIVLHGDGTRAPGDKKVGIFYFLWHEESNNHRPLYDHTKAYLEGGKDKVWDTLTDGDLGFAHYWAEPYFGYYSSTDEWVIRKHAYQLTAAGVDFIYFDATNGLVYEDCYMTVLSVFAKMREEGYDTPEVCFICQGGNQAEILDLYNKLYSKERYKDLWFTWEGKPLIMTTNQTELPEQTKDLFTYRISWANTSESWYTRAKGVRCWPWADMYPQKPGRGDDRDDIEQMVVMCGFWANGSYGTNGGRSYSGGKIPEYEGDWDFGFALKDTTSGLGLAFAEGFEYALEEDPSVIMITGWNEWWAGRWEAGAAIGQTIANEYTVSSSSKDREYHYYVDAFNTEYSRDIEAMKGGYGDNYYYQMTSYIREYKGTRSIETAFGQGDAGIKTDLSAWYTVGPEYRDHKGDTVDRNALSHVGGFTYTNTTGRNDFTVCKVSLDSEFACFYAECAKDITSPEGENWMNLFIDTDADPETGWNGYDIVVNRSRTDSTVSVDRFKDNSWSFESLGTAEYKIIGNTIQIKIPLSYIGSGDTFDFKWADNSVNDGDIMQFMDLGDAAPNDRFNYRYTKKAQEVKLPEALDSSMVVLKANSYNAFVGNKQVKLHSSGSTLAVTLASGYEFYLPLEFVSESLGIDVGSAAVYNHYGIEYVKASELIAASGKAVTVSNNGLIVISDEEITDEGVINTLYASLM